QSAGSSSRIRAPSRSLSQPPPGSTTASSGFESPQITAHRRRRGSASEISRAHGALRGQRAQGVATEGAAVAPQVGEREVFERPSGGGRFAHQRADDLMRAAKGDTL